MIAWTEQALAQLDHARDYISLSNSDKVADAVISCIVTAVQQLATFPLSGRAGRVSGTRELVVPGTPFLLAYAIDNRDIVVLAVYHGAQKWPEAFSGG